MTLLDWQTLKSRDSKNPNRFLINRGEIEIWNGHGEDGCGPWIKSIPLEECPENAHRCLHMDAKWINGSGLQCQDCKQLCFFGTFDALRWIIRQIQLGKSDTGCLLAEIKSDLERCNWEFSCVDLVSEALLVSSARGVPSRKTQVGVDTHHGRVNLMGVKQC